MSENLLILGAGVDRTEGIDFPLANTLLADVSRYLEGPGKAVDEALRTMLPGLRFSFNNMIARAVDKIATRETHEQKAMVQRVRDAIADLPPDQDAIRKHGELIIRLFEKLATIAEESYLDEETETLIRAVFPNDADDLIDSSGASDSPNKPGRVTMSRLARSASATRTSAASAASCTAPMAGLPSVPTEIMPTPAMALSINAPPRGYCSLTTPRVVGQKNVLPKP